MIDKIKRLSERNIILKGIINCCFFLTGIFISVISRLMRINPIKKNKIVCSSWKGKRCSDNPLYIVEELLKRNKDLEIVWLLNKNYKGDIPIGVRRADNTFFNAIYELVTAKVWIDCSTKQYGLKKRKGQLYIQTWHGSYGLKKMYGDIEEKLRYIEKTYMKYNAKITDVMVSNSRQTSDIYRRAFWYNKEIIEYGSPRNDIFFKENNETLEKVQDYFNARGKKIVLYAPTFRNNLKTNMFDLDYKKLICNLEQKFGNEWIVLVRLHPHNLCESEKFMKYDDKTFNASDYNSMQELLVASDVLITDYSSCMFDFVTTKKICFLYATDVARYKEERDYYFELKDLPFPLAQNNDEMEKVILSFEQDKYEEDLEKLFKQVGLNETGHASEKVADYIEEWMAND